VRASGAGSGCGSHWPLCNGEVVPATPSAATLIEYSHRLSSGLVLVLVVILVVWAFRLAPTADPLRKAATAALVLTLSEAALGAGLVLFRLVAHDESLARALTVAAHLLNTLLLLGALALTWRAAAARSDANPAPSPPAANLRWACYGALAAVMLLGATGAIAALGDTLFPSLTLAQGLAADWSAGTHLLLRLRVIHPFLALAVGLGLLALCTPLRAVPASRPWAMRLRLVVLAQWGAGLLDLALLAPLGLQMLHLLIADLLWIALVLASAEIIAPLAPRPAAAAVALPVVAAEASSTPAG
jgi:cytochrome c oxidase assembly protein subunit 15